MWAGVLIMFSCQASVRALVELNKNSVDKEESTREEAGAPVHPTNR